MSKEVCVHIYVLVFLSLVVVFRLEFVTLKDKTSSGATAFPFSYLWWTVWGVIRGLMRCPQPHLIDHRGKKKLKKNVLHSRDKPGGTSAIHDNELLFCLLVAKPLLSSGTTTALRFLKPKSEPKEISKSPQTVLQCGYQMVTLKILWRPLLHSRVMVQPKNCARDERFGRFDVAAGKQIILCEAYRFQSPHFIWGKTGKWLGLYV